MEELAEKDCLPSGPDTERLRGPALQELLPRLDSGWELVDEQRLRKSFAFDDFVSALAFVNRIGEMAEEQNHHPDLTLRWGEVVVEIWTHTIDGLAESDFVFAAKVDKLR